MYIYVVSEPSKIHQHKRNNLRRHNLGIELGMILGTVGSRGLILKDQLQQMTVCLVKQDGRSSVPTTVDVKDIVHYLE